LAINLPEALAVIASFNPSHQLSCLELPGSDESDFAQYLKAVCPKGSLALEAVGHPLELLSLEEISNNQGLGQPDMFSELTGQLGEWDSNWLLIAHEGGDPIIVKLSELAETSPVYSAMQGMGFWDFAPIADSIGQFLVCAFAIQHGLNFPGLAEPLDDDFNLAPAAANWLFPFLRQHAGAYYDEWASVFENYQSY
jgi:hypothetical protein